MHLSIFTLTVVLLATLVASAPIKDRNQTPAFDILPSSHSDVETRIVKPPARGPGTNDNVDVQSREVHSRHTTDPDGAYGIPQALPGSKLTDLAGWSKRGASQVHPLDVYSTERSPLESITRWFTLWKRFRTNCSQCHGFTTRLEKRPVIQNGNPTKKKENDGLWNLKREPKMGLANSAGQGGPSVAGNGGLAWG